MLITTNEIGGAKAEEIIEFAAGSKSAPTRHMVAELLRRYITPNSVKTLKRLTLDKDKGVRDAARESLKEVMRGFD